MSWLQTFIRVNHRRRMHAPTLRTGIRERLKASIALYNLSTAPAVAIIQSCACSLSPSSPTHDRCACSTISHSALAPVHRLDFELLSMNLCTERACPRSYRTYACQPRAQRLMRMSLSWGRWAGLHPCKLSTVCVVGVGGTAGSLCMRRGVLPLGGGVCGGHGGMHGGGGHSSACRSRCGGLCPHPVCFMLAALGEGRPAPW